MSRRTRSSASSGTGAAGNTLPTRTTVPPTATPARASPTACPEASMTTSGSRSSAVAPNREAKARRSSSGSRTSTTAPCSAAIAAALIPTRPAPWMRTAAPSRSMSRAARATAAHAVAVAQAAGASTAAGSASGTRTIAVPARSCTWLANAPVRSPWAPTRSWPYLPRTRHFCVRPRRQRSQVPQDTVTDQTTRSPIRSGVPSTASAPSSPIAMTRPTLSCPRTSGAGADRRPCTVCTSDPQIVDISTATSTS